MPLEFIATDEVESCSICSTPRGIVAVFGSMISSFELRIITRAPPSKLLDASTFNRFGKLYPLTFNNVSAGFEEEIAIAEEEI